MQEDIYRKMYCFLFNAVTDALEDLPEQAGTAKTRLILECEKMFVEAEDSLDE